MEQDKFLKPKHFIFICVCIIYFISLICDVAFASSENSEDDYKVSFRYYPRYNTTSNSSYIGLGYYSYNDLPYDSQDWTNLHTYTIDTSPVAIYSIIDRYDDFSFSVEGRVENDNVGTVRKFVLTNMNIYYELYPKHILTEAEIKGTLTTFIDDSYFDKGYTTAYLEGKNRTTGEWRILKSFEVHKNEVYNWSWSGTDALLSSNFTAYRINFSLWGWNYDGLSLVANGSSSGINKLVSCDFVGAETNKAEKMLEDLVGLQESTLNEIKNIGDLITNLPDLILDGLYELFVPDDLDTVLEDNIDRISEKLGILYLPFDFVIKEINILLNYNPKSTITFPSLSVMDYKLNDKITFDLNDVGKIRVASTDLWNNVNIIDIVHFFTTILIIYALVIMAIDVLNILFSNRAMSLYDDINAMGGSENDN